ncbi:hypothetical protein QUF49_11135 [Fictibacillus sp. b24]|uniref:hypothetical protein n=1 Tax=Fictibacillus sp. b24 TaxID=3055863 RepID=UPI0025A18AB3|nr:hypothetical protein [Fictibacillus sp. b24]MDM5316548.1 hypothetical protein [Fictibacillus sp. b24]
MNLFKLQEVSNLLQLNNIISQQLHSIRPSEGTLSLKINQLITAKVLEIFPDQTAKILYNGAALHAKLEAPLTKGNEYLFEVAEKNGNIVLKKIDSDPMKSTSEQILQKWNLTATDINKKAVDFSVLEKIPLTKENIKVVAELLKQTTELPLPDKKAIIHRMLELQLPPRIESIQAVSASFKMSSAFEEMKPLYDALIPYSHKDKMILKTVETLKNMYGFDSEEILSKPSILMESQQKTEVKTASESPTQNKLTLTDQRNLQNSDTKELHNPFLPTNKTETIPISSEMKRNPSQEFIQALEKWLQKSGLLHEKNILVDPVQVKAGESLKSQLLYLQHHADSLNLPESVLVKTEKAVALVTSQQLQNVQITENLQQYILQIPFGQSNNPKEMTITWEGKKQDGKAINPAHCRMLFWLEMQNLNEIAVDVQIQNRILSVKVFNEHPFLEKLSAPFLSSLKKRMKEMDYTLSSVTFVQQQKKMKTAEKPNFYKGLDLRV